MTIEENLQLLRQENETLRATLAESKTEKQSHALTGLGEMMKTLTPQLDMIKKNAEHLMKDGVMGMSKELKKADAVHGGLIKMMSDGTIVIVCTTESAEKYFKQLSKK